MEIILFYIIFFILYFMKIIYFIIDEQKIKEFNRVLFENYFIFIKQKYKLMYLSLVWCGFGFFQRKVIEFY